MRMCVTRSPSFCKVTVGLAVVPFGAWAQFVVAGAAELELSPFGISAANVPAPAAESVIAAGPGVPEVAAVFPPLFKNGTKAEGMIKVGCRT